jgi:hypothetical protein
MTKPIHLLSLGAGVQSSTLALMAAHGEVPGMPTPAGAIFADTQDEPASVYRWLDWLEAEIAQCPFPFPVYRVTRGSLRAKALQMHTSRTGLRFSKTDIPFFTLSKYGEQGKILARGCTRDFKIKPILEAARRLAAVPRKRRTGNEIHVIQWIGISLDEIYRMKPSRDWWAQNIWPLVDMRMSRHDCKLWMQRKGYPEPPRSSCVFCPFHNNHEWRLLRDHEPEAFQAAVDFEVALQSAKTSSDNFNTKPFLHRSCVPLDQVDLSTEEDGGQLNLFLNECEGMCGV